MIGSNKYKVEELGQVFTPEVIVNNIISLIKNGKNILEPSCGDGAFSDKLNQEFKKVTSIEFDPNHCPDYATNIDFFDYNINEKHDTIVGNPPYVSGKKIIKETLDKIDSKLITHSKSNLYLYFIEKCINHLTENGEIIFITPREFIKNTSSQKLNEYLYNAGTITHWIEFGDKVIFKGYSPSVVIFRFEKNNFSRRTLTNNGEMNFIYSNGQLLFLKDDLKGKRLGDLFQVKVGGVSGMDKIFAEESGETEFVCSYTGKTGKLKSYHYNTINDYILSKKDLILKRKIKIFNESNWWKWGRDFYKSDRNRIYVNSKTRNELPFFINDCKKYDGSVLALIPKSDEIESDIERYMIELNKTNWDLMGFKVGGRYIFSQKSLENIILDI